MLFHTALRAFANFSSSNESPTRESVPDMRNWSLVFPMYQHASAREFRRISSILPLRLSVTNVNAHVSHNHPRKTTVREDGHASPSVPPPRTVESCRYFAVGSRAAFLSASETSVCQIGRAGCTMAVAAAKLATRHMWMGERCSPRCETEKEESRGLCTGV